MFERVTEGERSLPNGCERDAVLLESSIRRNNDFTTIRECYLFIYLFLSVIGFVRTMLTWEPSLLFFLFGIWLFACCSPHIAAPTSIIGAPPTVNPLMGHRHGQRTVPFVNAVFSLTLSRNDAAFHLCHLFLWEGPFSITRFCSSFLSDWRKKKKKAF